jgi:RimJ/RimL family protein N-acetyltransferase
VNGTTIHIPTLETERLILRAPRMQDSASYVAFKTSERSKFTGGPIAADVARTNFSAVAGLWVSRGYGLFMAALKTDPETAIGGFGIFHPERQEEPEFGWSLYDAANEGKGYVTEAMRMVIPWAWDVIGVDTAQSHIDEGNAPSVAVATALGAKFDPATTKKANGPGGEFDGNAAFVNIYRHTKGALA